MLFFAVPNEWKKLRQLLTALLKKKLIISAKVLNYTKDYRLSPEGKIIKTEQKLLILNTEKEKNEILTFAHKMTPSFSLEELNQISFQ